jgi:probable HAF family extracellular repeat protein
MQTIRFLALCFAAALIQACGETTQPNGELELAGKVGQAPSITISDLGTLPGGNASSADDINARGDIVGTATTAAGEEHAVLWRDGIIADLGTLGGTFSQAHAINANGQVVGRATTSGGPEGTEYAFLWQDGRMISLGVPPGGTYSVGLGITPAGVVMAYTDVGLATWKSGKWTVLPYPVGGSNCSGGAIDNAGRVIGYCSMTTGQTRSFIWDRGVPVDLGSIGDGDVVAGGISPSGVVVGFFSTENGARPFLWKHGTITELTAQGADPSFGGGAINAAGMIAGAIYGGNFNLHAALWRRGTTIDLGTLPGGSDSGANGINAGGQIVGTSFNATGGYHAVLWTLH